MSGYLEDTGVFPENGLENPPLGLQWNFFAPAE